MLMPVWLCSHGNQQALALDYRDFLTRRMNSIIRFFRTRFLSLTFNEPGANYGRQGEDSTLARGFSQTLFTEKLADSVTFPNTTEKIRLVLQESVSETVTGSHPLARSIPQASLNHPLINNR
jgi:hypothetical protein